LRPLKHTIDLFPTLQSPFHLHLLFWSLIYIHLSNTQLSTLFHPSTRIINGPFRVTCIPRRGSASGNWYTGVMHTRDTGKCNYSRQSLSFSRFVCHTNSACMTCGPGWLLFCSLNRSCSCNSWWYCHISHNCRSCFWSRIPNLQCPVRWVWTVAGHHWPTLVIW